MKMQILRNSKGEFITMFEKNLTANVIIEPELDKGEEIVEVEMPDEYIRMPAAECIKNLEADIKAKRLEIRKSKF